MTAPTRVPLTVMDNRDPVLLTELLAAVERVARSGAFTGGEFVESFEARFADWCEAEYAVGVSSGTDALLLVLRALGVGPGDEVIVPANSFIATAEAVSLAGGRPRFADVDPDTQLVTVETLENAFGPRVCGIVPVHLFGRTADMAAISELARRRGVWVVEDCAQAAGARYHDRRIGTWGDAGVFSFYPAKNLGGWGDGGAIVTNRAELASSVRLLRSHGEEPRHHHRMIGTTARLDALQAAVLDCKLPHVDAWNAARKRNAAALRLAISSCEHVVAPARVEEPCDHVYHQFVVRAKDREKLRAHLHGQGIATAIHYPVPIHRSEAYRELVGFRDVAPTVTMLAAQICSLPMFPQMSGTQIAAVGSALGSYQPADTRAAA